jgi:hypothetical protein
MIIFYIAKVNQFSRRIFNIFESDFFCESSNPGPKLFQRKISVYISYKNFGLFILEIDFFQLFKGILK